MLSLIKRWNFIKEPLEKHLLKRQATLLNFDSFIQLDRRPLAIEIEPVSSLKGDRQSSA